MVIKDTDIYMIRGDSETIVVTLYDSKGKIVDLQDGDTIYFTVKEHVRNEAKVFQKVVTEFSDGKATIEIEPLDTKGCKFRDYVYDVQLTDSSGRVTTIVHPSKFTIGGEVTYE